MWETIAIIASLGGLEFILWVLNRRAARLDREMQRKQMEILDGILTELAILNSEDTTSPVRWESDGEIGHEGTGQQTENRNQEHPVCD